MFFFCAAINCISNFSNLKTAEVKGWHKVPLQKDQG